MCPSGWWPNITPTWISATCGPAPRLHCPGSKRSIASDAASMHIVGEGLARVAGGNEAHDRVVGGAHIELEFLTGRHLPQHFHRELEVGRLAPRGNRPVGATAELRSIDGRENPGAAVEDQCERGGCTDIADGPVGAGRNVNPQAIHDGTAA